MTVDVWRYGALSVLKNPDISKTVKKLRNVYGQTMFMHNVYKSKRNFKKTSTRKAVCFLDKKRSYISSDFVLRSFDSLFDSLSSMRR